MIDNSLNADDLLIKLLNFHQAGTDPEPTFLESNSAALQDLWNRGLGCWSVTTMVSGRIRLRRQHQGCLTPKGLAAAQALTR
jgi:hypothetical protein